VKAAMPRRTLVASVSCRSTTSIGVIVLWP
jgi:hypothetical protein